MVVTQTPLVNLLVVVAVRVQSVAQEQALVLLQ
jgi:hypothetical protein